MYDVGFKNKGFKEYPHDFLVEEFKTKELAKIKRKELQNLGMIQVIIRKRKGNRSITDF